MNKTSNLLEKIQLQKASWKDYEEFLHLNSEELNQFLELARERTIQIFGNKLKIYIPSKRFPSISLTGAECALECLHCDKKYLNGMTPIVQNEVLEEFLLRVATEGGTGALISGGCDSEGAVPLLEYLDTIKKIKKNTNLIINAHTGLLTETTANALVNAGVDIISFDITMDQNIISDIYRLKTKTPEDYKKSITLMKKKGLNVVPHICVGLYYGKLHKELEAIKFIKESKLKPSLIVLIALIPPKHGKETFKIPDPVDLAKIIAIIRFAFPDTEISLGCMRPRGALKGDIEKLAIRAGINRLEIPSRDSLEWLKKLDPRVEFEFYSACCAIPTVYEKFAGSRDSDIKGYLKMLKKFKKK
ncbi:MAG: radical SAM protein [Candidatus Lokiarchaeota archaeon]|nr:radical SAM protein [Candidatus Lokiarchaeota archaeon]